MNNCISTSADMVEIFNNLGDDVYNFVYYRLGQNHELAEDISQEVFLRAWKYREKFDGKRASVKTWLMVIAKNLIIDTYKSRRDHADESVLEKVAAEEEDHDKAILIDDIKQRIKKLNALEQEMITLRYVNGYSIEEVAEIIDKKPTATKVSLHRALNKLKLLII